MLERIVTLRRKDGCATVVFENGRTMRVPHAVYMLDRLREGQMIDPDKYEAWRKGVELPLAMERAVRYMQDTERAAGEVRARLKRCGYQPEVIDKVILTLQENRYLSDARFAGLYVDAKAAKLGRNRIRQELRRRGVDEETTRQALGAFTEEDELEQAICQAQKLMRRYDDDKKLLNAMIRRGYSFSQARKAISAARSHEEMDEEEC